jgi:hypothetical protein
MILALQIGRILNYAFVNIFELSISKIPLFPPTLKSLKIIIVYY